MTGVRGLPEHDEVRNGVLRQREFHGGIFRADRLHLVEKRRPEPADRIRRTEVVDHAQGAVSVMCRDARFGGYSAVKMLW